MLEYDLEAITQKGHKKEPPTLRVAGPGGFLGRKSDGEPGIQTLWLGLQRFNDIAATWLVMFYATQKPVSGRGDPE